MARMIPATLPEGVTSRAERILFPLLRDRLDESFTVFYSYHLLRPNREGALRNGEIDFLVFHQQHGFLAIEAKSGAIRYDGTTGTWYQDKVRLDKSPYDQALDGKYLVRNFLHDRLGLLPDLVYAHAVCFPDVGTAPTRLPASAEPVVTLTNRDLPHLQDAVVGAMTAFRKGHHRGLDPVGATRIRKALMPQFECGAALADRMADAERRIFLLTEEQCEILDVIHDHRQALVHGCAGSGKTVMAVKKARELGEQGKTVLLLAFNRIIGAELARAVSDLPTVTASHYHDYCVQRLEAAGRMPAIGGGGEFWQQEIPQHFQDLQKEDPVQFDAVIVDEGQDFRLEYWVTVSELVEPEGWFYIFYDENQNVYDVGLHFPITREPLRLNTNCRCSRSIFEALRPYAAANMRCRAGTPDGEPVRTITEPDPVARRQALARTLEDLVRRDRLAPEQVVVLGGHNMRNTCIGADSRVGPFTLSEADEPAPSEIAYHTYMKYKGCEADAVVLLDVDPADPRWSGNLPLYTAISRARHLLVVLHSM